MSTQEPGRRADDRSQRLAVVQAVTALQEARAELEAVAGYGAVQRYTDALLHAARVKQEDMRDADPDGYIDPDPSADHPLTLHTYRVEYRMRGLMEGLTVRADYYVRTYSHERARAIFEATHPGHRGVVLSEQVPADSARVLNRGDIREVPQFPYKR